MRVDVQKIKEREVVRVSSIYSWFAIPLGLLLFPLVLTGQEIRDSVFQVDVDRSSVPSLLKATQIVRELSEEETRRWIPEQSGFRYVDCPNCNGGRQENQLEWSPESPNQLRCRFCDHRYPSDLYRADRIVIAQTPRGETASYPYWEDRHGYRHFFAARRDDEARAFMADQARQLAQLYQITKDVSYARRAAVILHQFAMVFPNWCYHYDYPHRQKEIFDGEIEPNKFLAGFRTARWTWWAYSDIPVPLIQTLDWIRPSGVLQELSKEQHRNIEELISTDLIRNACEQVMSNRDELTNMSPTAWKGLILAGRVLPEPRYVHEPIRRMRNMIDTKFFYDGFWSEGSPDYGRQSLVGLDGVIQLLQGYSDPKGYRDPRNGSRYDQLDLKETFPGLAVASEALSKMRLPNGRSTPVHDAWSTSRGRPLALTTPFLLPALGHACLGGGEGPDQTQFHLTWSGGYGHSHADNLSLLLYAGEQEHLSDLGYTHTAYRAWTLATAAHNTVVIDGKNQSLGSIGKPSDGSLELMDFSDPYVQVVCADGARAYEGLAKRYARTLLVIDAGTKDWYAVDLFQVRGGSQHDYFLHGDADRTSILSGDLPSQSLMSLVPHPNRWIAPKHEGETSRISEPYYAYGFFRDLKQGELNAGEPNWIQMQGSETGGAGIRITLLPDQKGTLVVGTNPSIRQAKEDDAKLESFRRPFLLWRQEASEGENRFVSVLEPYAEPKPVRSITRWNLDDGGMVIEVEQQERIDWILLHAGRRVSVEKAGRQVFFEGSIGFVSWSRSDALHHCYVMGKGAIEWKGKEWRSLGPQQASLRSIHDGKAILEGSDTNVPSVGSYVRFTTQDGWVYPLQVNQVQFIDGRRVLSFQPELMMKYDDDHQLRLLSFPQREHRGEVQVQWNQGVSSR